MKKINAGEVILQHYPAATDCVDGHLGPEKTVMEKEVADDRTYDIRVTRCGHCGMPIRSEYV